jgi:protein PET117
MAERWAKVTLMGAVLFSSITIWAVHFQQQQERDIMYQGVLKDDERRREKRRQREEELLSSQRKRELYERVQKVEKSMDQPS